MNTVLKIVLSMSFSGGLLILVLLLGNRLLRDRVSRQWQYYIWLVVVLRLLLPFAPDTNLLGKTYQAVDQAVTAPLPQDRLNTLPSPPAAPPEPDSAEADYPAEAPAYPDIGALLIDHVWLIWLMAALGLLIRKITVYQGFIRYVRAGMTPVSDVELLDRLAVAAERAGVKKPVELCVNPLISSPLLIGFFRPCVVLPGADISERDFPYIALHELTHYRRRDMLYKWLVQVTVCLHWFNPLVHLMGRETEKACEFSCDEAVLAKAGGAQDYGETLLNAMAAVGKYKENPGPVTLSENKQLLRERIRAIMNFRKKSAAARLLTGVLTLCMILSAAFVGVYSAAAADVPGPADLERPLPAKSDNSPPADASPVMETLELKGTTYCLVRSEAQLRAIGTGEYGMDQNYMQQADIQLSAEEWTPIGTWDDPFTGSFNGNGFEIVGLTMTDPDAKVIGLFGVAEKAHIYNVTLRDYDITSAGGNVQGKSVGAILAVGQGSRSYDNAAYPKEADVGQTAVGQPAGIDRYYEAGSLPLFEIAFSRLDKSAQQTWLEKLYAGDDFAFFSAAVRGLDAGSSLLAGFAEKAYTDGEIAFFSTLSDGMGETELESWLDRALEDGKWNFQSMLFNKLDRNDEFDERIEAQEKEWAEAQRAEYRAAGVTMDGKNYYYRGKLVNIFLDVRKNGSFYVLDMNPKGTVNIKIIRDAGGKVTGAAYMTDAEAAGLLADMEEDDDDWQEASGGGDWHVIPVDLESVADKEIVWLGEYILSEGDRIWYDVSAETGAGLQVGFARPEDKRLDTAYYSVKNLRQKDKDLRCAVSFTFGPPAEPGTYQLFLRAINGALGDVKGSISIGFAADAS